MKENLMFAYLFHVSHNMWPDRDSTVFLGKSKDEIEHIVGDLRIEWDKFDELIDFMPKCGFNTMLLDVGDAVRYDRHPELAENLTMSKDEFKKMLDKIRAKGMTPIPKLNFSGGHDAWMKEYSNMVGSEEYYQTCLDCIDEVAELFDYPAYFHLGLDEEVYAHQKNHGVATIRSPEIFWRDAYKLFDRCSHYNMRPWIWSDAYWHFPKDFLRWVPKEVLQSNWYYSPCRGKDETGEYIQPKFQAYLDLDAAGYDQVPTGSTWGSEFNLEDTFKLCKEDLLPGGRLKGVMTAPWTFCHKEMFYVLMQEARCFGDAKEMYFPKEGCANE